MRILLGFFIACAGAMAAAQGVCPDNPQTPNTPKVVDCTGAHCTVPIVTSAELYGALNKAVTDLGHSQFGFPVDVLAASYGVKDPGWDFALRPWRFRKDRIRETLRELKRYGQNQSRLPSLVAVNLPSLGFHFYDAALVRSLFMTDLFPFDLHVVQTNEGSKSSYVLLKTEFVQDAKTAFDRLSSEKCSEQVASLGASSLPLGDDSDPRQSFVAHLKATSYVTGDTSMDQPVGPETKPLANWLPSLPTMSYSVSMKFDQNQWICDDWSHQTKSYADQLIGPLGDAGCLLTIIIELPDGTDSAYDAIILAGNIEIYPYRCNPRHFGQVPDPRVDMLKCEDEKVKWSMSGDALRGGRTETLQIAVRKSSFSSSMGGSSSPAMVIGLSGKRIGPLARPVISCWCSSTKCTDQQLRDCRTAATH
jgi:hypothetical protein